MARTKEGEVAFFSPGTERGWVLVKDNQDPRKREWELRHIPSGKVISKKTGAITLGGNLGTWIQGGWKNMSDLHKKNMEERLAYIKQRNAEGYYLVKGKWKKKNVLAIDPENEIVNANAEKILEENTDEKLIIDEQPIGTDLGIGSYMDLINLDINYQLPENQLKVDKPQIPNNSMPSTKYANTEVGKYYTYKGKRYKKGSVGARKADRAMEAKLKAQEMARKRLQIQAENS